MMNLSTLPVDKSIAVGVLTVFFLLGWRGKQRKEAAQQEASVEQEPRTNDHNHDEHASSSNNQEEVQASLLFLGGIIASCCIFGVGWAIYTLLAPWSPTKTVGFAAVALLYGHCSKQRKGAKKKRRKESKRSKRGQKEQEQEPMLLMDEMERKEKEEDSGNAILVVTIGIPVYFGMMLMVWKAIRSLYITGASMLPSGVWLDYVVPGMLLMCVISGCYRILRRRALQKTEPTLLHSLLDVLLVFILCTILVWYQCGEELQRMITGSVYFPQAQLVNGLELPVWIKVLIGATGMPLLKLAKSTFVEFTDRRTSETPFEQWLKRYNDSNPTQDQCRNLLDKLSQDGKLLNWNNTSLEPTSTGVSKSLVVWDQGIRVEWLQSVFFRIPAIQKFVRYGCHVWFFRDYILHEFLKHQGFDGQAMIDWAAQVSKKKATGRPDRFISYTGAYKLSTLIDTIQDLPPETVVWLDLFNVNQFLWRSKSVEALAQKGDFRNSLGEAINSIQNTLLLVERSQHIEDATRKLWVVWELYLTMKAEAKLEICAAGNTRREFVHETLLRGISGIYAAIAEIDVLQAKASREEDRVSILKIVEEAGATNVNMIVRIGLCAWYETALRNVKESGFLSDDERAEADCLIADSLIAQGRMEEAARFLSQSLESRLSKTDSSHVGREDRGRCIGLLNRIVDVYYELRNLDAADTYAQRLIVECKSFYASSLSNNTVAAVAKSGDVYMLGGRLVEARRQYSWCLSALSERPPTYPLILRIRYSLAQVEFLDSNVELSRSIFEELLSDAERSLGEEHKLTESVTDWLLAARLRASWVNEESIPLAKALLSTRRSTYGENHPLTEVARQLLQGAYDTTISIAVDWNIVHPSIVERKLVALSMVDVIDSPE